MHDFQKLALDWLAEQPNPIAVTREPELWAERTAEAIRQRVQELVDHLAPPDPDEPFLDRIGRMNTARRTATEIAIEEHLPYQPPAERSEDWAPLLPDLSDLL